MRGSYCLMAFLPEDCEIEVGKLGVFSFSRGYYAYAGSAMSSLEARLARHLRKEKKRKWHIDHFLQRAVPVGFLPILLEKKECSINSSLLREGVVMAKGFGSSDCSCPSHLVYLGD